MMRHPALPCNLRSEVSGLTMGNYKALPDLMGEAAFVSTFGAHPGTARSEMSGRGPACPAVQARTHTCISSQGVYRERPLSGEGSHLKPFPGLSAETFLSGAFKSFSSILTRYSLLFLS